MPKKFEKAIVVGASSGIGREVARLLAEEGCRVAVVGRRTDRLQYFATSYTGLAHAYVHDVRNIDEVPGLMAQITRDLGGLDLLFVAVGTMPYVELDEFDYQKDNEIWQTNVVGACAWINEAAARFQGTGHGCIAAVGSVAGDRGRQGQPAYNASKAALHAYMEAIRNRLSPLGVAVCTFKPGPVATEMTARLDLKNPMSSEEAAKRIRSKLGITGDHYLKFSHRLVFAVIRILPGWMMRRLPI